MGLCAYAESDIMFLLTVLLIVAFSGADGRSSYIINGSESSPGRWPWQVSIQMNYWGGTSTMAHECGGSVLNEHWVITAAHCCEYKPTKAKLWFGAFQLSKKDRAQELSVAKAIVHPGWDSSKNGMPNDLCLLKVDTPIDLSNPLIKAVRLAEVGVSYAGNPDCWISGWGRDDRNIFAASDKLKESNVPVITNRDCMRKYGGEDMSLMIKSVHICMDGTANDVHACHGDSGGPMVCRRGGEYELVGVASRAGSPQCGERPSVYTRVSKYLDWIHSHIDS